jgi:hypothetical protein
MVVVYPLCIGALMTKEQLALINVLFHFTDRRNLVSIRQHGGLWALAEMKRRGIEIPAPGGNQLSHDLDSTRRLDEYVHLCFRWTHPMEHVARADGRITDSIFLNVHPEVLQWDGVRFTPDVSNKSGVQVHPIEEAANLIDFEVLYSWTDWRDPAVQGRLSQAEKCEILVPRFIPLDLIRNFPNG